MYFLSDRKAIQGDDFLEWEGLNHCVSVFYSALVQLRRQERRKKKQKRKREEEAKKKLQKVV